MQRDKYEYEYSAPTRSDRRVVEDIRKQYLPPSEQTATERIKKLDKRVKRLPLLLALTLGIAGILTFGLGLTFVLEWRKLAIGVVIMLIGFIPMLAAYPVHELTLKRSKEKYGPEILRLAQSVLDGEQEQNLQNINE